MLPQITPLILTYNEAPNIRRTLAKLTWAQEIVVVDNFSTDETLDILKSFPKVRFVQRQIDTFAGQCNFGLENIRTRWVLSLDADYLLSDELNRELVELAPQSDVVGYKVRFIYCVHGRELRASLYPPRTVLYRKDRARYRDEGHGHRVQIDGRVVELREPILHDDRKSLSHWLRSQDRYAQLETEHLMRPKEQGAEEPKNIQHRTSNVEHRMSNIQRPVLTEAEDGGRSKIVFVSRKSTGQLPTTKPSWPDRVRRLMVVAPFAVFFYTLLGKGLILDGWPGWYYVFQRTLAELILSLRLIEKKLKH